MDDHTYGGARPSPGYDRTQDNDSFASESFASDSFASDSFAAEIILPAGRSALENVRPFKGRSFDRNPDNAPAIAEIIGSSAAAVRLRETIDLYAGDEAPVMITGETGAGKELVARRLHNASMRRRNGAFAAINAGAMPETLAASEFFGHDRGAFTGAVSERDGALVLADGGVLFLDEIGDMPLSIQTHLLRVLEDGKVTRLGGKTSRKVDFRLIAATNVDLKRRVNAGAFRKDLYYRVNVLTIDVPPLRARGDDAVEIAEAMIAAHPDERRRKTKLTPKAADRLRTHHFPGNVRELRNVLSRALVHAERGKILPEHLAFDADAAAFAGDLKLDDGRKLMTRFLTMKAMRSADGNVKRAADMLGVARNTMYGLINDLEKDYGADGRHALCDGMKTLLDDC